MYHYLKWAAFSLFLKRNLRYLLTIAAAFAGIFITDALYEDISAYYIAANNGDEIFRYLFIKWIAIALFVAIIFWSIIKLGFGRSGKKSLKNKKESVLPEDPYTRRLEKFNSKKSLLSKSDLVIRSHKKQK